MTNRISRIYQFITKVRGKYFVFNVDMDSPESINHALDTAERWAEDKTIRFPWKKMDKLARVLRKIWKARNGKR